MITRLPKQFGLTLLLSFSQVFLQKNALTGALFIFGIGLNSPIMLIGALVAVTVATITASSLNNSRQKVARGIYGFNAALSGIATFYYFTPTPFSLALLIFSASVSSVIMHFIMNTFPKVPALTSAFVLSTWMQLLIGNSCGLLKSDLHAQLAQLGDFETSMLGIGEVMFQGYWLTGAIFLAGLLSSSVGSAFWALIGSALAILIARTLGYSDDLIMNGTYSFNAALTAVFLFQYNSSKTLLTVIGIVFSVLLTHTFLMISIPPLTAPFVLSSWMAIGLLKIRTDSLT